MAYPRSFLGLLLTGFTVVALPLVGALAYSAWNTERLAEQSRTAVFSASQAARVSRSLVSRISSIERLAQQLAVVEDPALAVDYARVHQGFRQIADELLLLPLDAQQLAALKKTVGQERQLYELVGTPPRRRQDPRQISRMASELAENAYEVLAISYLVADREVERLRSSAEEVQRRLVLLVILSTAVALGIALALTRYISRPLAPPQRQVVAIMRDNSVKLQRLIEDLLDYQRALHSAGPLQARAVALDALVQDVARPHQLAVQAKGQRLELDLDKVSVEADPEKLRSIIDNLLGNAVKFTPSGGTIKVLTRAAAREAMVEVIDTGPGVPLEERAWIFDSYFRGRAKASGRIEGTGLGLAIAREFVEAHGGRISVVSETSGGHFRVTLPP